MLRAFIREKAMAHAVTMMHAAIMILRTAGEKTLADAIEEAVRGHLHSWRRLEPDDRNKLTGMNEDDQLTMEIAREFPANSNLPLA